MNDDEFLDLARSNFPRETKTRWVPILSKTNNSDRPDIVATKFFGSSPFMLEDVKWPKCAYCKKRKSKVQKGRFRRTKKGRILMAFVVQFNLADFPQEFKEETGIASGLLQVFECPKCHITASFSYTAEELEVPVVPSLKSNCASAVAANPLPTEELPSVLQDHVQRVKDKEVDSVFAPGPKEEYFVDAWTPETEMNVDKYGGRDDVIAQIGNRLGIHYRSNDVKIAGFSRRHADEQCPTCQVNLVPTAFVDLLDSLFEKYCGKHCLDSQFELLVCPICKVSTGPD